MASPITGHGGNLSGYAIVPASRAVIIAIIGFATFDIIGPIVKKILPRVGNLCKFGLTFFAIIRAPNRKISARF
jgi:hypothetical protein